MSNYTHYTVGRNYIKSTEYDRINTGRRKRATPDQSQSVPMTASELITAYQYRQREKREKLLRLADVNFEAGACVFLTLTFRENIDDYDTAIKAFKGFTKRVRRKLEEVRYIATLEIQQRGAYHFHLLVNVPDYQFGLDNLAPLWQNGIVSIEPVSNVKNVMLYTTKDLLKQDRSHLLFNRRCYFVSQGLTKCIEVTTWNSTVAQVQEVKKMLQGKTPIRSKPVDGTRAGHVKYADFYFPTGMYPAPPTAKVRR